MVSALQGPRELVGLQVGVVRRDRWQGRYGFSRQWRRVQVIVVVVIKGEVEVVVVVDENGTIQFQGRYSPATDGGPIIEAGARVVGIGSSGTVRGRFGGCGGARGFGGPTIAMIGPDKRAVVGSRRGDVGICWWQWRDGGRGGGWVEEGCCEAGEYLANFEGFGQTFAAAKTVSEPAVVVPVPVPVSGLFGIRSAGSWREYDSR